MKPEAVARRGGRGVSLLGRGGAGFPAGRKWSMLRKARDHATSWSTATRASRRTFKDHLLIERDPHQLIEGVIIAAYALQVHARPSSTCAASSPSGSSASQPALNEAYATARSARDIFGSGFSLDIVVHPGAGAYICGEETALLESLEGKRGLPADQAALLPRRHRPLRRADGREQRRDDVEPALDRAATAAPPSPRSATGARPGTRLFALSGHVRTARRLRGRDGRRPPSATSSTTPRSAAASTAAGELKAFIPGGVSAPWFGPDQLDLAARTRTRWPRRARCSARGRSWSWTTTTCAVRAAWRITRFFSRESCGQCTPCREGSRLAREDPRPHRGRRGPRRATSTSLIGHLATTSRPGLTLAARSRPRSACSARRSRRRSPRPSGCSATSSSRHVKARSGCPHG